MARDIRLAMPRATGVPWVVLASVKTGITQEDVLNGETVDSITMLPH